MIGGRIILHSTSILELELRENAFIVINMTIKNLEKSLQTITMPTYVNTLAQLGQGGHGDHYYYVHSCTV